MLFEVSEGVIALGSAVGFPNEYESLQASVLTIRVVPE